ncbi:hypothetical protein RRF57_004636 [Xylaria bambusicola]|uniref:Succinate dehydrogenase assembly factor 2, mitochondrial n=1 Tax=Xylaria bambusicola TaxID=326684 RepID=A0AAN7UM55_9PEZI
MASLPHTFSRPARHALLRLTASQVRTSRALGVSAARGMSSVGSVPPTEPQKERHREMAVGEFEGATVKIEPLRRVGEDEKTMRARLVYQSRKRGILETDLLLSTFADEYLPTMTREEMSQYDLFLDENDWDIYYWATQEEPSSSTSSSTSSTSSTTTDTSSASYGSSAETATATETAGSSTDTASASESSTTSTGGIPLEGEHIDTKAAPPPPSSPYKGEWAQTVGTFKPAYRPVPVRWRDSAVLKLLREHVRARSGEKGGMAFMPALRS